jgi:hypothetical protein
MRHHHMVFEMTANKNALSTVFLKQGSITYQAVILEIVLTLLGLTRMLGPFRESPWEM